MFRSIIGAGAVMALMAPAIAQAPIRTERVRFAPGTSSQAIRGTIRGYASVDYLVGARGGQAMTVSLKTSNGSSYFNVLPPGSIDQAIFTGAADGNSFRGRLPSSGDYRIRVYLMRNAARRNESASYILTVGIGGQAGPERPGQGGPGYPSTPPGSGAAISPGNMGAFCRGEASAQYGVRPAYVKTRRIVPAPGGGSWIDGTVDKGREGIKRFKCRFDNRRRFIDVMAMTRDGE